MNLAISRQQQHHVHQVGHLNGENKKKKERPKPIGSALLTDAENERLFCTLGKERISLSAGVAQLLSAYLETPNIWRRANVGVVLLIKDYLNRNYALCMYDIFKQQLLWKQILYRNFTSQFYPNCPRFITFEGDACMHGLCFTDFDEAQKFKITLDRRRDHEQRLNRSHQQNSPANNVLCRNMPDPALQYPSAPALMQQSHQNGTVHVTGITNSGTVPHIGGGNIQHTHPKVRNTKNGKNKKRKERITKEDIGNPTNFMHKVHIGWDAYGGFKNEFHGSPMDESVREVIKTIGMNPDEINPADAKFIQKFVKDYKDNNNSVAINKQQPQPNSVQISTGSLAQGAGYSTYNSSQPMRQPPPRPPPFNSVGAAHPMTTASAMDITTNPSTPGPPPPQRVPGASLTSNKQTMRHPAPPPPPTPQIAPTTQLVREKPPPPPIPPVMHQSKKEPDSLSRSGAQIPPPPPPPPPAQIKPTVSAENVAIPKQPTVESGRANLLQQIQQGAKLRKIGLPSDDRSPIPTNPPNTRDNMMEQIKQGTNLKHVDHTEVENNRKSGGLQELGGIAGALARALEERRKNIMHSDDSSDSSSETNNDSEWEDCDN